MNKHPFTLDFPGDSVIKNPPDNAGDLGLNPGSGRSPEGGNGNPLQYSCLENPMDRGAWWAMVHGVTKNQTRPSEWACIPGQRGLLVSLRDLTLLWLVGAGGSVLSVSGLCLLDPCFVTFSSCQACGPAGEHTTWRADSLRKWHPGPHVLGKSCSLQTWAGRAHEIMSLATTWMDLEIIIHRELRHRQIPYDITYLQNLKKIIQMNLFTKLKQTHRLRKQIYGRRGEENKLITKGEMLREE